MMIKVGNSNRDKLKIGISNTNYPKDDYLSNLILGNVDRSLKKYKSLACIINETIENELDLIVLPECFLPIEWLTACVRACSKNKIGFVSGMEHILHNKTLSNYTVTALPFEDKYGHVDALLSFHKKKHYAPSEIEHIENDGYQYSAGKEYELFCWNNIWFTPYCCYELTSIEDRALFKSIVDFKIVVECNKDINYFSNIIESMARDLHCYCIQVNNSKYGDSRITGPFPSFNIDLIKVKGGKGTTILFDTIDIKKLREFQLDPYKNDNYKYIPPSLNREIIMKKYKGNLFEYLTKCKEYE